MRIQNPINQVLGQKKDLPYNIRSEVSYLRSLPGTTKRLSEEIEEVKKELITLEKNHKKSNNCPSCIR